MWNLLEIFSMTAMLQSGLNTYDEGKLTLTRNSMKESSLRCMLVLMAISLYSSTPKRLISRGM